MLESIKEQLQLYKVCCAKELIKIMFEKNHLI